MVTLKETLREARDTARRTGDELRKSTLTLVLSEIQNQEKAGKVAQDFSDDQVMALLQKEARKRHAAAEEYVQAGKAATDVQLARSARELAEAAVIEAYLPQALTEAEVDALITNAIEVTGATGPRDMGGVMKQVNAQVKGRFDGKAIAEKVKTQLAAIAG